MNIQPITDFVVLETRQPPDATPIAVLKHEKNQTTIELIGAVLEAQFKVDDHYLLLMTEDCPYEEALHIYLLDTQLAVLDYIELSAMYAPGIIDDIQIQSPHTISFSFFERDEIWQLQLLEKPVRSLQMNHPPAKRRKSFWAKRWITLKKAQGIG